MSEPTEVGDTIELLSTTDDHTTLAPGARGQVTFIDDIGTVHAQWEDGSRLGLIPGEDRWRVIGGTNTWVIRASAIGRCPRHSILPSHYYRDGICLCVQEDTDQ